MESKIVAIGGGTGLSTLLRGLKAYTSQLTAVVTVADDGGSSGRLRRGLGVLPPGDFRQCISALAEAEPLMSQLFEYRFGEGSGLDGHSFGNLFLVALSGITGSFESALREASRVLAVRGRILPATLHNLVLCAELTNGSIVCGESKLVQANSKIHRVFLEPEDSPAYPEVIQAILEANAIVIGPGSLYTSILPNLLVRDITRAIQASTGLKIYVCNVASQPGETDNYNLSDYLTAIRRHVVSLPLDAVLVNSNFTPNIPAEWKVSYVSIDPDAAKFKIPVIEADLVDEQRPTRHDSAKLARTLMEFISGEKPLIR
ncbi:MAG: hypothetical protein A2Z04_01075 [Chloroflexi bacterium RBG_16_57_9]|nr:MAG: hypothetical protein A2Z04_01075 [Chloroflexi bacterium RBG_16_57_9]